MYKLNSSDEVKKSIVNIGRAGVRLIAAVQTAAVQVIGHAVKHGDITLAQSLVDNVTKHHKAALVAFMETYGPFKYEGEGKNKKLAFYRDNANLKAAGIKVPDGDLTQDYVDALPRWETGKAPVEPQSIYDMHEEVSKFLDRMIKASAKPGVKVQHADILAKMRALYNREVAALTFDESNIDPAHIEGTPEAKQQDHFREVQFGPVAVNQ